MVAANSGIGRAPGWYFNLRDHPESVIELAGESMVVHAELLSPADAENRWPTVLLQAPDYGRYVSRTGQIPPIFRLNGNRDGADLPVPFGSSPARDGRRRPARAVLTAAVAASAYAGATGADPYLRHLTLRLPFHSPIFGAAALAAVVGVPHTVAARDAWSGDPRSDMSTAIAGGVLCGWLVVETAVLREWSFLDPIYGAVGVGEVITGRRRPRPGTAGP